MLKSTAALLGLLFAISSAYYLSFWGFFDINIFQYIEIPDIIKGPVYPLRFGVGWVIFFALLILYIITEVIIKKAFEQKAQSAKEIKAYRKDVLIGLSVCAVPGAIYLLWFSDNTWMGLLFSTTVCFLILHATTATDLSLNALIKQATGEGDEKPAVEELWSGIASIFLIPLLTFLTVNALVSGQVEARSIRSGKRFDYVATKELPTGVIKTSQPYLIFLGAVSSKCFFIDQTGSERFIVDKATLPVIKTYHFEQGDKVAEKLFAAISSTGAAQHL